MTRTLALTTLALAAGVARGQVVSIIIEIDEPILAPGDSTSVRLLAGWSGTDYAVAGVHTDLVFETLGADLSDAWSEPALIAPMAGPGTSPGVQVPGRFADVIAGQLNFPPAGIYAIPQPNPIPFWEATFTAPVDGGGYVVDLSTISERFDVYIEQHTAISESRLDVLTEGEGTIFVIPSPASGALALLGLGAVTRRRR